MSVQEVVPTQEVVVSDEKSSKDLPSDAKASQEDRAKAHGDDEDKFEAPDADGNAQPFNPHPDLQKLIPALRQPSLHSLILKDFNNYTPRGVFTWRLEPRVLNLTKIVLTKTHMDARLLAAIIRSCTALKELHYDHDIQGRNSLMPPGTRNPRKDQNLSFVSLKDELYMHRKTLERLSVSDTQDLKDEGTIEMRCDCSFAAFTALTHMTVRLADITYRDSTAAD